MEENKKQKNGHTPTALHNNFGLVKRKKGKKSKSIQVHSQAQ